MNHSSFQSTLKFAVASLNILKGNYKSYQK